MADKLYISKITLPDGNTYEVKDLGARELIAELAAKGITFVVSTDAATTPQGVTWETDQGVEVVGTLVASGDITSIYLVPAKVGTKKFYSEYVVINIGTEQVPSYTWEKLGDTDISFDSLGDLAYKDSASGSITLLVGVTSTLNNGAASVSGSYTPAGTVSSSFTGTTLTSNGEYTPAGTVTKPNITVTTTSTVSAASKLSTSGSVTAGTAATFTEGAFTQGSFTQGTDTFVKPVLTTTVSNETLTIGFSQGSFTQGTDTYVKPTKAADTFNGGTPTAVTLPTFTNVNILSGVSAELASTPTFSGTTASIQVTGTPAGTVGSTFSGTAGTVNSTGTVTGTISNTYTTSASTVTVS